MAIRIKSNANKLIKMYSVFDSAIDRDHPDTDLDKYIETNDAKYLRFHEVNPAAGKYPPTVFWGHPLDWKRFKPVLIGCLGMDFEQRLAWEGFRRSMKKFDDAIYLDEEETDPSQQVKSLPCTYEPVPGEGRVVSDAVMRMLDEDCINDIGSRMIIFSGLSEKIEEFYKELLARLNARIEIIPREIEKNSSAPASSDGSPKKGSSAGGVNKTQSSNSVSGAESHRPEKKTTRKRSGKSPRTEKTGGRQLEP